ncbi:MAG: DUF4255 domain-containing protein [Oscillatoria sp. SIO1A7]|nr:DUF4255 domain-containing protein [Oscillatoria sp. SIO1A7]
MLQDLDKTLEKLLKLELPALFAPGSGTEVRISFTTPDEESLAQKPVINLFLYEVRENMELRNPGYSMERLGNGSALKKLPPVRVDCSYLITVWPADSSDAETEHRLLGEVMKVLLRYPKIPAEVLQGSLQGQQPPLRANTLRTSQLQSFGEFWQAMGGKPKATLNYTVTISVEVWEAAEVVPLVMEK